MANTPQQYTLEKPASLKGTSLHTGEEVTLTLHPAEPGTGYKFLRSDLPDGPTVDAVVSNVKTVERATTLAEGNVKVQTVEHVLSALRGMGVDNAVIEMNANEPPIGDGSAQLFVQLIKKAGVICQEVPRPVFEIRETIHFESPQGSLMTIVPANTFRISCTQVGPGGRFTQFYSTEVTPEIYEEAISPARTFVYYEDVKELMEKGLIRGGSLENALVIRDETVLSKESLRFPDEFARHKVLDIIGDLALFPHYIKGHVMAVKPGHSANTELARRVAKEHASMIAMVPPQTIPTGESVLDVNEVMRILPHRYPFLLVDRIVGFEGDNKCTGIKNVTINEPFFKGHFPGHPIMPGVLQVEAMAQTASVLMMRQSENAGKIGYFMSADKVKFRKPVLPGDTLFIHVELTKARRNLGKAVCKCVVNNNVVSEGELMFSLLER